jgi:carboxypeptidase Q
MPDPNISRSSAPLGAAFFGLALSLANPAIAVPPEPGVAAYADVSAKLVQAAHASDTAFQRLAFLCDTFGPRFSGSTNLESAIDWVLAEAKKDGFDNVHGETVSVPHWVRGAESVTLIEPRGQTLRMAGLGGSVGTPAEGIQADVLVVKDFDDLKARAAQAKGRIVLFNAPFVNYGQTVQYRYNGAVEAAKAGAVGSLVRSVTPFSLQTPHTGAMRYDDGVAPIPHAAITVEDAEMLQRMQDRGQKIAVRLKMEARTLPKTQSRNVIAEINGREKPDEIVIVSGHIDSWDNTLGAFDDGGGVLSAWEALRLMRQLGLRPRRTIRLVLWTNEENGMAGAHTYAAQHKAEAAKHVLAIESDMGAFKPLGFICASSDAALSQAAEIGKLLDPIQAGAVKRGGADSDLGDLRSMGVPCMALLTKNDDYFRYHHTGADTPDKVNPAELRQCAAAMAVMAYVAAEMPSPLAR